jgi:catechol 2,3-dioxygenase-like lactoylglutathione lyase family enzyme
MWADGMVTFLHTDDLARTHKFYTGVLGLDLYIDQGACRIYQVTQDSYVGFCSHFEPADPDGVIITLLTDDVDGVYERLSEDPAANPEEPPKENPEFNIYHFFVADPNGYKVEVQKFLD